ncbi:putative drug exporter of the RND superfamily [Actinokineospora alba]|uniref:Putative drug exporter of the RND superfamily n=1 Tax=Actinokineospora alba TaxID=504798 RepID=A0A1H0GAC4_9PSEU|nr:efflux RND transporter permease subunit [Actinokineospora alba]TDP69824.1 RND superfamily putative drug exporter [Actinokineospora alba]SDI07857.1 putative drug exporter of the RND superfamily [Actinokineospora alba]SDO03833.1 putative drug exporter of the RND superfamily [Actinokineospora alba]
MSTTSGTARPKTARWLLPALLIVGWLVVGAVGGPFAGKLSQVAEQDSTTFLPRSAEATRVDELQRAFAGSRAVPAILVAERPSGITAEDDRYLADRLAAVGDVDGVDQATPRWLPAPDSPAARQAVISVDAGVDPGEAIGEVRDRLEANRPAGLTLLVTGPAAQAADLGEAFAGIDGLLLLVAGAVVVLILIVVYRSPILPLVVLMSAVFALGLASLAVYLLAKNDVLDLNGQSQGILFILVFGAATDYALLLVSRFREELRDTDDRHRAIRTSLRSTIEPIAASAGTVILGVLCLLFSDLNSNRGLGPVAAIGIGAAFLTTTTFLPAVLVVFGRTAFWPRRPTLGSPHPETSGLWGRVSGWVGRAPRAIWVVTTLVLLVGAAFLPQLRASGTAQSDVFLTDVDSAAGQQVVSRYFPGGTGAPTVVIARADRADEVLAESRVDGVSTATVTMADGRPKVVDGRVKIDVVLADPADSDAAIDTVTRVRAAVHAVPGADALVGGPTASQLDTRATSERDRAVIIPIVLIVIFAVLALLLRSLLAPALLIATVVLSFAATMGVSALVFNGILGFPGADPVVPLFGFVFLVALGIDYNIFLMTRVREETRALGTREGTLRGLSLTGGVITSAGVVLAATFAALAVIPILFLAQLAFIVAFGVLVDTLIVRSLLVPALVVDLGRIVWWPSRLDKSRSDWIKPGETPHGPRVRGTAR